MGIPLAVFGILPNSIIGDIAEADAVVTGQNKTAIFYGARTFMSKIGQMIAGLIFPSLLLIGSIRDNDIGIRLTGLAAVFFVVIGLLCFLYYDENKVLRILRDHASKQSSSVPPEVPATNNSQNSDKNGD